MLRVLAGNKFKKKKCISSNLLRGKLDVHERIVEIYKYGTNLVGLET